MQVSEKTITSSDKQSRIYGKIYIPDGEPKGLIQIVHGMTEHIERYDETMTFLCEKDYLVFGHNHLGHKNSSPQESLGYFAQKDGYKYLVNDVILFKNEVCREYPDVPVFLFGHSMGSFIARLAALECGDTLNGLIICGTGGPNPAAAAGLVICDIIKKFKGERYISNTVYRMAFGTYNKRFEGSGEYNWLSADRQNIKNFENDPYCTFKFTISGMHDLVNLNKKSNSPFWYKNISKKLPIFLISGSEDPVGNYGNGVKRVYKKLKNQNCRVEIKLYEGMRHEILNDYCKKQVQQDILDFIEKSI